MYKGTLSRQEAVDQVGEGLVSRVDAQSCDFSSRLMPAGYEDVIEFTASVQGDDNDGARCTLIAYYYQDADDVMAAEELDHLDWRIHGYDIV